MKIIQVLNLPIDNGGERCENKMGANCTESNE